MARLQRNLRRVFKISISYGYLKPYLSDIQVNYGKREEKILLFFDRRDKKIENKIVRLNVFELKKCPTIT